MRASRETVSVMVCRRPLEVEQHRQVVALAQFLAEGIEDGFALRREAAEDQHHLGGDGVDHVADPLVVEQQVDELGHLEVVDGDLGLVLPGDDQVGLPCSLQVEVPGGYAVNAAAREIGIAQVRMD